MSQPTPKSAAPFQTARVVQGGLVAGPVLNLVDAPNGALVAGPRIEAFLHGLGVMPNPLVPAYFVSFHFLYGILIVGTYAAFTSAYGPGARTALRAAGLLVAVTRGMALGFVVMGLLPMGLFLLLSTTMIAGSLLGGVVGARVHDRGRAGAGSATTPLASVVA